MNNELPAAAMRHYRSVDAYGSVESANPHRLVELLYDGLADALSQARGAIERGDIASKCTAIGKAVGIMEALAASLDKERGGDVAGNLARLYDYMERELTRANLHNDVAALGNVASVNETLRGAWASIPPEARSGSMAA